MKDKQNFEERSRQSWHANGESGIISQQIGVGCLQRIATALESLSRSWANVQKESVELRLKVSRLERSNKRIKRENERLKKVQP